MFEFEFTFLLVSNCRRSDKVSRDFYNKNSGSLTTFCGVSTQYTRNNVFLLLLLTSHHSQRVDNGFKRHYLKMHHQTNTKQFHLGAKHSNVIKNTPLLSVKYIQISFPFAIVKMLKETILMHRATSRKLPDCTNAEIHRPSDQAVGSLPRF